MAGETSSRHWYLIVRREGHDAQRIKLPIALKQIGRDLDDLVENLHYTSGYDLIDDDTILPSDDRDMVVSYEFHSVTQPWEANEID
jgi:hypothetical protein